jgi:hypothetical protein
MGLLVAFVLAIVGVVFMWVRHQHRAERDRGIAALAESLHLTYSQIDLFDDLWQPFHFFGLGTARGIENVLAGTVDGVDVRAFDYWYEPVSDGSFDVVEGRRRFSCGVVAVPASCPKLAVQPRTTTDDLIGLVGGDVLPLELEEFNRRFRVRCEDQRFAVAFLEQRMMEALLRLPVPAAMAASEDRVLLVARQLPVEQVALLLRAVASIRHVFPRSLPSIYPLRAGATGTLDAVSAAEAAEGFGRLVADRERKQDRAEGGVYPW